MTALYQVDVIFAGARMNSAEAESYREAVLQARYLMAEFAAISEQVEVLTVDGEVVYYADRITGAQWPEDVSVVSAALLSRGVL